MDFIITSIDIRGIVSKKIFLRRRNNLLFWMRQVRKYLWAYAYTEGIDRPAPIYQKLWKPLMKQYGNVDTLPESTVESIGMVVKHRTG